MHEAGLARGVAKALKERGLRLDQVCLKVRGGHHVPADFDRELRAHLTAAMPDQAAAIATLPIWRASFGHLCPRCAVEFESAVVAPLCPVCGSQTLPDVFDEEVEIQSLEAVR